MSGIARRKVVALDSNVFIYHFESNPHFTAYTDAIFKKLVEKKLRAITSIISVIEALSYPSSSTVVQQIEEGFNVVPNLTIYEVNREIALQTARIRREYKYRLPDAVQLATALYGNAHVFISNDKRLKKFKELPIILIKDFK